jgi:hypothetical protein
MIEAKQIHVLDLGLVVFAGLVITVGPVPDTGFPD